MSSGKTLLTEHRWLLLDAANQVVGRLASRIAPIITGKSKPTYSPHLDHGDNVVVINCQQMILRGNKYKDKHFVWHTGHVGNLYQRSPQYYAEEKGRPEEILLRAVSGMLPKNNLRNPRLERLVLSKDSLLPSVILAHFPPNLVLEQGLGLAPKYPVKTASPLRKEPQVMSKEEAEELMEIRRGVEEQVDAEMEKDARWKKKV